MCTTYSANGAGIVAGVPVAAISTPPSQGGIAVIRVSGERAMHIATRVFRPRYPLAEAADVADMAGYTACYGVIPDVDECVLLCFRSPHSYTGEDTAEFQVHGGEYVASKVLSAVLAAGATPARAGEFTYRAYMNGKLSLTRAEAVADIISADNARALAIANSNKNGRLDTIIGGITDRIKHAAAQVTAYLDYPDEFEEFEEFESGSVLSLINEATAETQRLIASYDAGSIYKNGITTAIIGKPNVGKSSIMNGICGREKSIVAYIAGTTRDIVEDFVNIGGVKLNLADCAGLRGDSGDVGIADTCIIDTVEAVGISRMRERAAAAELIIAVFDGSRVCDREDEAVIALARGQDTPCQATPQSTPRKNCIFVINKSDLPQKFVFPIKADTVSVCAKQGDILEVLTPHIKAAAGAYGDVDTALLNGRQLSSASLASEHLNSAKSALTGGMVDVCGVMLTQALAAFDELLGTRAYDSVIAEVFGRFCVGK